MAAAGVSEADAPVDTVSRTPSDSSLSLGTEQVMNMAGSQVSSDDALEEDLITMAGVMNGLPVVDATPQTATQDQHQGDKVAEEDRESGQRDRGKQLHSSHSAALADNWTDEAIFASTVNVTVMNLEEEAETKICRICLSGDDVEGDMDPNDSELLAPCACRGSSKWVHRGCVRRWNQERHAIKCEVCLEIYPEEICDQRFVVDPLEERRLDFERAAAQLRFLDVTLSQGGRMTGNITPMRLNRSNRRLERDASESISLDTSLMPSCICCCRTIGLIAMVSFGMCVVFLLKPYEDASAFVAIHLSSALLVWFTAPVLRPEYSLCQNVLEKYQKYLTSNMQTYIGILCFTFASVASFSTFLSAILTIVMLTEDEDCDALQRDETNGDRPESICNERQFVFIIWTSESVMILLLFFWHFCCSPYQSDRADRQRRGTRELRDEDGHSLSSPSPSSPSSSRSHFHNGRGRGGSRLTMVVDDRGRMGIVDVEAVAHQVLSPRSLTATVTQILTHREQEQMRYESNIDNMLRLSQQLHREAIAEHGIERSTNAASRWVGSPGDRRTRLPNR